MKVSYLMSFLQPVIRLRNGYLRLQFGASRGQWNECCFACMRL